MNLLFELFTEELPASEMNGLDERVKNTLDALLNESTIVYDDLIIYITPRRIAVKFSFDEYIKSTNKEIVGPPATICFKNGQPTKALLGFLKKNNAEAKDVQIKETAKGKYVSIVLKGESKPAKPLMPNIMHSFLNKLHFNKKMRWGNGKFEFIRPVHNVTFTIDNEVINFDFASISSTSYTYGHRFLSKGKIEVAYENYEEKLKDSFVIVNQEQRKQIILNQLDSVCKKSELEVVHDDELLNEIMNLTEYPKVIVGDFEERFLKLPKEVLITSMKDHQRYFAFMKNRKLSNKFAAVSNIETDNMDVIKKGYERVLRARFSDAEFFFNEDSKHKIEDFVDGLRNMMFHEKLGTQYARVERLVSLSEFIADMLHFDSQKAKRAAYLSKADLLTQMVYEFPELQGVMGKEYAVLSNEDKEVAEAIYEQYLPRENEIPKTNTGIILSLADKFDLVIGGFIAGLKPTGTKDPYALRRAALGIIKILLDNKINANIASIIDKSYQLYSKESEVNKIVDFIKIRFKNYLAQYPHDTLEAVESSKFDDIYDAYLRLEAINNLFKNDIDKEKRFLTKRVFNIVKDFDKTDVDESLFSQKEEKELYRNVGELEKSTAQYIENKNYDALLNDIISIRENINTFFDNVMVMDKDMKIRENRLSLLNRLKNIVLNVADFKFLEI